MKAGTASSYRMEASPAQPAWTNSAAPRNLFTPR